MAGPKTAANRGLQYAGNLFPANQIDGYHTTFTLITMSVDAEYEVVVDAALAFGGLDHHDALNSRYAARRLGTGVNSTKRRLVSGQYC